MPEISDAVLVLLGAISASLIAAIGFLLRRRFDKDPVDTFIQRYERLRAGADTSAPALTSHLELQSTEGSFSQAGPPAPSSSPALAEYEKAVPITQADMNKAAAEDLAVATGLLDEHIYSASQLLGKERLNALKESQRAWIRYRDLFAGTVADSVAGGSMWPTLYDCERTRLTKARIEEIKALIEEE